MECVLCYFCLHFVYCFLNPTLMTTTTLCHITVFISTSSVLHLLSLGCNDQGQRKFLEVKLGVHLDELFRDHSFHHSHCGWIAVGLRRSLTGPSFFLQFWCGQGLWPHVQGMYIPTNNESRWRSINVFLINSSIKSSHSENHCSTLWQEMCMFLKALTHFNDLNLWIYLEKWK